MQFAEIKKAAVAVAGFVGLVATFIIEHGTDWVPPQYVAMAQGLIALLTAVGVYGVPQLPNTEIRAAVRQSGGSVVLPGGLAAPTVEPLMVTGPATPHVSKKTRRNPKV